MNFRTTASRAATLLTKNPNLFYRVMLGKLNTTRRMPPLPARKRMRDVIFECSLVGYSGTAPMYFGSYALIVIEAMERFLKPGDVFLDIGANVGYLSAIAASIVGKKGEVHSFEPVSAHFDRLRRLVELNPGHTIIANSCAAGEMPAMCAIHVAREAGQSTLVPGYKTAPEITSTVKVPVLRLDSYIEERQLDRVALIKIDAEGYELPILKGLEGYFEKCKHLPPVICEIAPRAYPLIGKKLLDLAIYMKRCGYAARDLIDCSTPVDLLAIQHVEDVLFFPGRNS